MAHLQLVQCDELSARRSMTVTCMCAYSHTYLYIYISRHKKDTNRVRLQYSERCRMPLPGAIFDAFSAASMPAPSATIPARHPAKHPQAWGVEATQFFAIAPALFLQSLDAQGATPVASATMNDMTTCQNLTSTNGYWLRRCLNQTCSASLRSCYEIEPNGTGKMSGCFWQRLGIHHMHSVNVNPV